jgi:hypothetical protein
MRAMHRERLELLQGLRNTSSGAVPTVGFSTQRIHEIEAQILQLLQRHKLIHNTVFAMNAAIVLFVICMFIIALAVPTNSTLTATIALLTFLTGTGMLLVGASSPPWNSPDHSAK